MLKKRHQAHPLFSLAGAPEGALTPSGSVPFPFVAAASQSAVKRALILLAIEPRLRGALLAGPRGSGKTMLIRGFIDLVSGLGDGRAPAIELPLNATDDRLLGGLDFERTLKTGRPAVAQGLLAAADGGLLHVDEINLLDRRATGLLAAALDRQSVRLEREGLSQEQPARFTLLGSYDPLEGDPPPLIRDRVGITIDSGGACGADDAARIVSLRSEFDRAPEQFRDEYVLETTALRAAILEARAALPRVRISSGRLRRLLDAASSLGVEGNYADLLAVYAARANAAFEHRLRVSEDDLVVAIRLVLVPRARQAPVADARTRVQKPDVEYDYRDSPVDSKVESQNEPNHPEPDHPAPDRGEPPNAVADLVLRAIDIDPGVDLAKAATGSSASPARSRARYEDSNAGRYYRSTAQKPASKKIAIAPTIRAAAGNPLRAAACQTMSSPERQKRLHLRPDDLRYKHFKRRSGTMFIFVVDASGSMAINRMAQAKGAMLRLLERAYLNRDKVAMISFRKAGAEVLLQPTRSVALARRLVDAMPAGGATPLAAGLIRALEVARCERARGAGKTALLLFTDGRVNVASGDAPIREELKILGAELEARGLNATVVDTRLRFVQNGEAEALAGLLRARYVHLPRGGSDWIHAAVEARPAPGVEV
jgi:magnesium chelatase subunit D